MSVYYIARKSRKVEDISNALIGFDFPENHETLLFAQKLFYEFSPSEKIDTVY